MASRRSSPPAIPAPGRPTLRRYLPALVLMAGVVAVWLVIAIWVVFLGGPSSARSHRIDTVIVPGSSVAGIALGDPRSGIEGRLGPSSSGAYVVGLLQVDYGGDGRVSAISTRSPRLRTPEGIGVGARLADVKHVYPRALCPAAAHACTLYTADATTRFLACPDGRVDDVMVASLLVSGASRAPLPATCRSA